MEDYKERREMEEKKERERKREKGARVGVADDWTPLSLLGFSFFLFLFLFLKVKCSI